MRIYFLVYILILIMFSCGCAGRNIYTKLSSCISSSFYAQFGVRYIIANNIVPMLGEISLNDKGNGNLTLIFQQGITFGNCNYINLENNFKEVHMICKQKVSINKNFEHMLNILGIALYNISKELSKKTQFHKIIINDEWIGDFFFEDEYLHCKYKDNRGSKINFIFTKIIHKDVNS
ncbi:MAG: hypothetical protein IJU65_04040 [Desulfovibrio sp.]|nr:hypothetical protein [Desulfovibrio sp.]